MRFCENHWNRLREAVKVRGMEPLVPTNGEEAIRRTVAKLQHEEREEDYDPLMSCHWMIVNRVVEMLGLYVMGGEEEYCPVCEYLARHDEQCKHPNCIGHDAIEDEFINGPADAALEHVRARPALAARLEPIH